MISPQLSSSPGPFLGQVPAEASPARHCMIRDKIRHVLAAGTTTKGQVSGAQREKQGNYGRTEPTPGATPFPPLRGSSPIRRQNSLTTPHALVGSHQRLPRKCFQAGGEMNQKGKQQPQAQKGQRSSVTLTPGTEFTCLAR